MTKATKVTPKKTDNDWHAKFLELLAKTCNVTQSAKGVGIHRKTAYEHRAAQPDFAAAWDDAIESAVDLLEAEARKRALLASDTLLIFLLKAHRPEKYRERYDFKHSNSQVDVRKLSDEELKSIVESAG